MRIVKWVGGRQNQSLRLEHVAWDTVWGLFTNMGLGSLLEFSRQRAEVVRPWRGRWGESSSGRVATSTPGGTLQAILRDYRGLALFLDLLAEKMAKQKGRVSAY